MDEQQGTNAAASFPWTEIFTGLAGAVTTAVAYFAGKKKIDAETKGLEADSDLKESAVASSELDIVQKAIAIWRESAETLKSENKLLHEECNKLRQEQTDMRMEISQVKGLMNSIKKENKDLKEEIERLKAA